MTSQSGDLLHVLYEFATRINAVVINTIGTAHLLVDLQTEFSISSR